ncbi:MAG: helix-turn-helix transcriptional regulator [Clostridia bacterium]|nr:helix-turn-helix transcriptional regulator [Clostridia bacterium]
MEFNEKLQQLRKRKGITQEELAEAIFVSRTAVSKWESGRGYPSIDSLKALSEFFEVTIDELLSGEKLLIIAEEDTTQKQNLFRDLVFGLLDICIAMFFFVPFFGQTINENIQAASLLSLIEISPYLRIVYFAVVISIVLMGILTLALQKCQNTFWIKNKSKISLILNTVGILIFIISTQPYAAAFMFVLLIIKAILYIKWQ